MLNESCPILHLKDLAGAVRSRAKHGGDKIKQLCAYLDVFCDVKHVETSHDFITVHLLVSICWNFRKAESSHFLFTVASDSAWGYVPSRAECRFCCNFVTEKNVFVIYHYCSLQLSLIGSNVQCFMVTVRCVHLCVFCVGFYTITFVLVACLSMWVIQRDGCIATREHVLWIRNNNGGESWLIQIQKLNSSSCVHIPVEGNISILTNVDVICCRSRWLSR